MIIYVDSSTKENCLVVEGQSPSIRAYKAPVTSNVGEYKAVIRALKLALTSGYDKVEIRTDSKLVADQLNGLAKVKSHHLRPYFASALELKQRLGAEVKWISREINLAGKVLE